MRTSARKSRRYAFSYFKYLSSLPTLITLPHRFVGYTITKDDGAYFNRTAWAAYSSITDAQNDLVLEVKVKLTSLHSGVFFYNAQSDSGNGDYIALAVKQGRVEMQFDSGSGPTCHDVTLTPTLKYLSAMFFCWRHRCGTAVE